MSKKKLTPAEIVSVAHRSDRPRFQRYLNELFTDFFELHGDRLDGDDPSILGGIARFHGTPVTVIGQRKGTNLDENILYQFGMPNPCGYRKAQRLARQAEKFGRPIITWIDTPGAYPGVEAEQKGQGEAIASCLALFSDLHVPVIAVLIGEGGSGGALALGVENTVIMLENAMYSVLSPEGFASILWKDSSRVDEACEVMKLTAADLYRFGVIDRIVEEGEGGAHVNPDIVVQNLDAALQTELERLMKMSGPELAEQRYMRFRKIGALSDVTSGKEQTE